MRAIEQLNKISNWMQVGTSLTSTQTAIRSIVRCNVERTSACVRACVRACVCIIYAKAISHVTVQDSETNAESTSV